MLFQVDTKPRREYKFDSRYVYGGENFKYGNSSQVCFRRCLMSKKIVVIDDDQDILEIIKAILKTKGYYVYPANNGDDGWTIIQQQRPDLVITDLKMVGISGLEICRRIRASEELKETPIIVMSGIGRETGKPDEFWRQGLKADDFISKPFDPLDILGRVEFIFRRKTYVSAGAPQKETAPQRPSPASGPRPTAPPRSPAPLDKKKPAPPISPAQEAVPIAPAPPKASPERKEKMPEDVVRDFVESWNTQNFPLEYRCLADEMTGGLSEQDYVRRRMQAYQETLGQLHTQHLVKVEESNISRQIAKVTILREDKQGSRTTQTRQTYVLRKITRSWGIVSVKTQSL